MVDVHVGQNVHSYVQMNAAPPGSRAAPHPSQVARISRAINRPALSSYDVRLHRRVRQLAEDAYFPMMSRAPAATASIDMMRLSPEKLR